MRKSIYIFVYCLLFTVYCFGQDTKTDSLLTLSNTLKEDTTKVNVLNNLFLQYEYSDDAKAKECLSKALALAKKIDYKKGLADAHKYSGFFAEDKGDYSEALKNYFAAMRIYELVPMPGGQVGNKKGIASSYANIGNVYYNQGLYAEAIENYLASLKIRKAIGDKKGESSSYNDIANVYYDQDNYPDALKNNLASLKIKKELADKRGMSNSYNNIGNVYSRQGNYPEALKNHFASLKIREEIGDKKGISDSYGNIGNVYSSQKNSPEALKNFYSCLKIKKEIADNRGVAMSYSNIGAVYEAMNNFTEALKNHFDALHIREAIDDKKGIADSYNNIGSVYYEQGVREKNPDKLDQALKNHMLSLKIKEAIGDRSGTVASYGNMGIIFTKQKKYKEAGEYLTIATNLSKEIGYKEYVKELYIALTELDSARGNYKGAFENHKLYILYRDSLDNEQTRKKTIQSQMTFDFEKKEAVANAEHKIELENQQIFAEEKSRKQKIVIIFVVCGLIFVLVFAGFIFRSLRVTRKQKDIIEKQKRIVETQKQEVEQQKHIVEEHQKAIIDSITYARRIQQSLLPTEKYIEKQLNRLMKK